MYLPNHQLEWGEAKVGDSVWVSDDVEVWRCNYLRIWSTNIHTLIIHHVIPLAVRAGANPAYSGFPHPRPATAPGRESIAQGTAVHPKFPEA